MTCPWHKIVNAQCIEKVELDSLAYYSGEAGSKINSLPDTNKFELMANDAISVTVSNVNSAYISKDGTLYTCGNNGSGQLGRVLASSSSGNIFEVAGTGNYRYCTSTNYRLYVIDNNDNLYACGKGEDGMLGLPAQQIGSLPPATISHSSLQFITGDVKTVSAGETNVAIVKNDGSLYTFGYSDSGSLGLGFYSGLRATPEFVGGGYDFAEAGGNQLLAVKQNGDLFVAGDNSDGQIGLGSSFNSLSMSFCKANIKAVATGNDHSVIVDNDGNLLSTGANNKGQLGDGTTYSKNTFAQIATGFIDCFTGENSSFAIDTNHNLFGFGTNKDGVLAIDSNAGYSHETLQAVTDTNGQAGHYTFVEVSPTRVINTSNATVALQLLDLV